MVIDDLDVLGPVVPDEADPPLIVDPDRMLPGPLALQRLQPVPRGHAKVGQHGGGGDHVELPVCDPIDRPEGRSLDPTEQGGGPLAAERSDHTGPRLTPNVTSSGGGSSRRGTGLRHRHGRRRRTVVRWMPSRSAVSWVESPAASISAAAAQSMRWWESGLGAVERDIA